VRLAEAEGRVLMVDHPFLFTGSVRKIRELVADGDLGRLQYFDSERVNLGLLRSDVNVLWDLAPHDISILQYLLGRTPSGARAVASSHTQNAHADPHGEIAHLHLDYPDGFTAHIAVSWLSPVKIRKIILGGDRKMVLFDDISPSEKVKIYDYGIGIDASAATPFRPLYRSGDVLIPKYDDREAMQLAVDHFVSCVRNREKPLTDARFGLEVVRVLDASDRSLRQDGVRISLP
ncbi:MAG: Gfo/Idh/MocA family oxidoreductase, partial [bacterium]